MASTKGLSLERLFAAVQPLLCAVVLLYLFPGLFSDDHADALVANCHLDRFLEIPLSIPWS